MFYFHCSDFIMNMQRNLRNVFIMSMQGNLRNAFIMSMQRNLRNSFTIDLFVQSRLRSVKCLADRELPPGRKGEF